MVRCQPPRYLQIEPTTRCNFTCGFCAGRHLEQQDLDYAAFRRFVDGLEDPAHVELQGEGEPLLHPSFFAMARYLRQRFPAVRISLITNGSLFTGEHIDELLACGVRSIMVSLESAQDAVFRAIRGGRLERVRRGIRQLLQRRQSLGAALPTVGLAVTLLRQTCAGVGGIATLYDELGLDGGIMMQPLQGMAVYARHYDAAMRANLLQPDDTARIRGIVARDDVLRAHLERYRRVPNFYSELYASPQSAEPTCPWLEQGLFVSASGHAASCCFVKHAQRDGFGPVDGDAARILALRADMLRRLREGDVPAQCRGCALANRMRRFARLRGGSR